MPRKFDSVAFVTQVGRELVSAFEIAGFATTPGQIGSAREVPVRDKLVQLLPRGIGVGSGCVIDSSCNTSRQMDVVLYEKDICPVLAINDDPASTYFPCEGVMAVGEIKSAIGSNELTDIFGKIESAKRLRRFSQLSPSGNPRIGDCAAFIHYGSLGSVATPKPDDYNQATHPTDQIYGFAMSGRVDLSPETLCDTFIGLAAGVGYQRSPNLVVALDGSVLCPISIPTDRHNPSITVSAQEANSMYLVKHAGKSFPFLLARLQTVYTTGRTVPALAFDRYFAEDGILSLPSDGTPRWLPSLD